jgi:hypothetical protein
VEKLTQRFRILAALLAALTVAGLARANVPHSAAELKAVFLFNFGSFVEWPPEAMPAAGQPFCIGVCGSPEVASALEAVVAGERIQNHPVRVVLVRHRAEALSCQILYLAAGEEGVVNADALRGKAILTTGDTDRFEAGGGIVRFVPERNRIRLVVDLDHARAAGLKISSQLLRIAETRGSP